MKGRQRFFGWSGFLRPTASPDGARYDLRQIDTNIFARRGELIVIRCRIVALCVGFYQGAPEIDRSLA